MGELSKFVGEVGEDVAKYFFEKIGWKNSLANIELVCVRGEKHALNGRKTRNTHGIDRLFSYMSNVEDHTLQHVYISCKCTSNSYPSNPISTFKNHLKDLEQGMECFKRSPTKADISNKFSSYSRQNETGVLFWISYDKNSYEDVISKISSCRIDSEFDYGSIHLIDNDVVNFHLKTIRFIENKFCGSWNYYLHETSINYSDKSITRKTKILPVEYLNAKAICFLIDNKNLEVSKPIFIIQVKDKFSYEVLDMYVSVARELTGEITNHYCIVFPDYVALEHLSEVKKVIMKQPESLNIELMVDSYNDHGVRGVYNEQ